MAVLDASHTSICVVGATRGGGQVRRRVGRLAFAIAVHADSNGHRERWARRGDVGYAAALLIGV